MYVVKIALSMLLGVNMTVGELKKMLEKYPDDMSIIHTFCSDYAHIEEKEWSIIEGVDKGGYVMRTHPTMAKEHKIEKFLHLVGN